MNIAKDPRVAKGSTYSAARAAASRALEVGELSASSGAAAKARRASRRKKPTSIYSYSPSAATRDDLDLAPYLTEQARPVATSEEGCQTAEFAARPPSPAFVPKKTGVDVCTQLGAEPGEEGDSALFDFDLEVQNLLGVIVGKAMEQALLEVESEEELAGLARQEAELLAQQEAELRSVREADRESIRRAREKRERVREEVASAEGRDALRMKVAAVRMMKQCLPVMQAGVYEEEVRAGRWVVSDIGQDFVPWLLEAVRGRLEDKRRGGEVVDGAIRAALERARNVEAGARAERERLRKEEEAAEAARRRARVGKVKINITAAALSMKEDKQVGPVEITGADTVGDLEAKILDWLTAEGEDFTPPAAGFLQLGFEGKVLGKDTVVMDIPGGGELSVVGGEEEKKEES
ncbi:hypothetical protein TeGR_g7430 [Tetraparma gracilis]|uniref:Uncharacterized protein n=1 Tax=Tetraparma gracilis TaxID=2962635 RepID=A0ABQ6N9K8_9STRA|nr:hypothetical protein TeGR_g7430 [Tetraparma gracilis]